VEPTDRFPDKMACRTWEQDDKILYVVKNSLPEKEAGFILSRGLPLSTSWYCGYVRFPKRPVKEPGYHGIMAYVQVHGGLTYAEEDLGDGSMVYGFDCNHAGDQGFLLPGEKRNVWTDDLVAAECEKMIVGIVVAAEFEDPYLKAPTEEARAKVLDMYHDELRHLLGQEFEITDNFGAMINVITGHL